MHIIESNVVRGRLSENYLTRNFIARNINDFWYSLVVLPEIYDSRPTCSRGRFTINPLQPSYKVINVYPI